MSIILLLSLNVGWLLNMLSLDELLLLGWHMPRAAAQGPHLGSHIDAVQACCCDSPGSQQQHYCVHIEAAAPVVEQLTSLFWRRQ